MINSQTRDGASTLKMRNVYTGKRRTSVRLEPELWRALETVTAAEGLSINELCRELDELRGARGLTSALRVYIVTKLAERAGYPLTP